MVDESETLSGSLDDVRAFCAVIDFGTVSAAARHLEETKGSVSRRISRLERRLGTALLARTPRAVTATEEGLAFYAKAREALLLLQDAAEGVRQSQGTPQGQLRVTAPVDFGIDLLSPLVARFRALHPQVTVQLMLTNAQLDLAANRIDLALRAMGGDLPDMGYRASKLIDFEFGLFAAPGYLAREGAPAGPEALTAHALLVSRELAGGAPMTLQHDKGRQQQVAARPAIRTSDYASVHRLAQAEAGIGVLSDLLAAASVREGRLVRVLPEWRLETASLYAISVSGRDAPVRVCAFRDFLKQELAAL